MKKELEKLKKPEGEEMHPHEKMAKMAVLQHLKKTAEDAMKEHMGGMKKVSVMSDSPEGLKEGLDKAKGMVGKLDSDEEGFGDHGSEDGDPLEHQNEHELTRGDVNSPGHSTHEEHENTEDHSKEPEDGDMEDRDAVPGDDGDEANASDEDMSHEELDAKIQRLMHLKSAKQAKMRG